MTLGLNTYSYHLAFGRHADRRRDGPMTLAKCLNRARKLGFTSVQIDSQHFNAERDNPAWVKRMAGNLGISLIASSSSIEPETLRQSIELARTWETSVIRTGLGLSSRLRPDDVDRYIDKTTETISASISAVEDAGAALAIENNGWISTPDLLRLVESVERPSVQVCVDIAKSMLALESPVDTVAKLAPHAIMANVKDVKTMPTTYGSKVTGVALGSGDVDLATVLPLLVDAPGMQHVMLGLAMEATGSDSEMLNREDSAVAKSVEFWNAWTSQRSR